MSAGNGATVAESGNRVKEATPLTRQAAESMARCPPHSVEAEMGILGSCLMSPAAIWEAQEKIDGEYFYVPAHEAIWTVMVDLSEQKRSIDLITFTQELRDRNLLEAVGGAAFVTALFTFVPTAANIGYYIDIVRDKYILRSLIAACTEAVRRSYEEQDDVNSLLDEVQEKITGIALGKLGESPGVQIKDDVLGVIEEFENAHKHRGRTQGLATGFVDLDRMTSGIHPGDYWVIAGRPSMGKTALAMNIAEHVAVSRKDGKWDYKGQPVWVFSIETSRRRLVRRLVAGRAYVSMQKQRDGMLAEADFPKITEAADKLMHAPIYIDETPALNLYQLKPRMRMAAVTLGVKLFVIDYMQLMKSWSKRSEFSRVLELTDISAGIKNTARELGVAVVVVVALNRDAEKTDSGRPRMSHLRECGAVEYDADVIGLIYRPEYYESDEERRAELAGEAELIIAKQKDGPVGSVALTFLKEFTRFEDRAYRDGAERQLYSNRPEHRQDDL